MKLSFQISLLLLVCLLPNFSFGNDLETTYLEQELVIPTIEPADWDKATEGLDYGEGVYIKPKQTTGGGGEFLAGLLKILLILIIVLIIIFLLRYFVGIQGVQKATNQNFDPNATIDTQNVAERIHEFDLPSLIQQAIDRKEYMIATRLYYLLTIRTLSERKHIIWKKDKTNRNYLNELSGMSMKNDFLDITNIFERVWYGEVKINEAIFGEIKTQFQQFINTIPTKKEAVTATK